MKIFLDSDLSILLIMKFYCYDRLSFYVQGRWKNLRYVLTATCMPNGDGIDWQLREKTFKYDLTVSASLPCLGNLLQVILTTFYATTNG